MTDKGQTNRKWTSTPRYREGWGRVFGGREMFGGESDRERLAREYLEDCPMFGVGVTEDVEDFQEGLVLLEEDGADLSEMDSHEARRRMDELRKKDV